MKLAQTALGLALLASLAAPTAAAGQPIVPTARMGIERLVTAYSEAWIDGRERHVMKLLHDDAVLIPHHGAAPVSGRDAILDFWWPLGGTKFGVTRYDIEIDEIYGEGELAYVLARFEIEYWMGEGDEKKIYRNEGNWLALLTKEGHDPWRISRLMWNDPLEQVEAAPEETEP